MKELTVEERLERLERHASSQTSMVAVLTVVLIQARHLTRDQGLMVIAAGSDKPFPGPPDQARERLLEAAREYLSRPESTAPTSAPDPFRPLRSPGPPGRPSERPTRSG